jgi:hypothetical protein
MVQQIMKMEKRMVKEMKNQVGETAVETGGEGEAAADGVITVVEAVVVDGEETEAAEDVEVVGVTRSPV